jgi:hypothetical protein
MTEPPLRPTLTPTFCFNTRFLRDFLRLSRSQIDDSISTNLNALLTPSQLGFDPTSTTTRTPPRTRNPIPQISCATFTTSVLFPSWQARTDVLTYCARVATFPDPNDPQLPEIETWNRRDRDKIVDERLDPYTGKNYQRESRTEQLASLLRNEEAVERIVRERTWGVVQERCQGYVGEGWESALDKWREGNKK